MLIFRNLSLLCILTLTVSCAGSTNGIKNRKESSNLMSLNSLTLEGKLDEITDIILEKYKSKSTTEESFNQSNLKQFFTSIYKNEGQMKRFYPSKFSIYEINNEQELSHCKKNRCRLIAINSILDSWYSPYHIYKDKPLEIRAVFYLRLLKQDKENISITIKSSKVQAIFGTKCCGVHTAFYQDIQDFNEANVRYEMQRILMFIDDILKSELKK